MAYMPGSLGRPPLDMPPPPPTEVQSQMGMPQPPSPAAASLAPVAQRGMGAPAPGAPNPHGMIVAQAAAIRDVVAEMARNEPRFAPFAQKITQLLDTGVSAVSAPPGLGGGQPGPMMSPPAPGGPGQIPPLA